MSTERPILMCGDMVRAVLAGRKTQARRVLVPPHHGSAYKCLPAHRWSVGALPGGRGWAAVDVPDARLEDWVVHRGQGFPCPYGQPGCRLYVKEATWIGCERVPNGTTKTGRPKYRYVPLGAYVVYCATDPKPMRRIDNNPNRLWRYKAARFMPRWATRLWLELTSVRLERIQAISEADAAAEGLRVAEVPARTRFAERWDSLNLERGCGWETNPWVWVLTFKVLT